MNNDNESSSNSRMMPTNRWVEDVTKLRRSLDTLRDCIRKYPNQMYRTVERDVITESLNSQLRQINDNLEHINALSPSELLAEVTSNSNMRDRRRIHDSSRCCSDIEQIRNEYRRRFYAAPDALINVLVTANSGRIIPSIHIETFKYLMPLICPPDRRKRTHQQLSLPAAIDNSDLDVILKRIRLGDDENKCLTMSTTQLSTMTSIHPSPSPIIHPPWQQP